MVWIKVFAVAIKICWAGLESSAYNSQAHTIAVKISVVLEIFVSKIPLINSTSWSSLYKMKHANKCCPRSFAACDMHLVDIGRQQLVKLNYFSMFWTIAKLLKLTK